jgi:hypothetical protein
LDNKKKKIWNFPVKLVVIRVRSVLGELPLELLPQVLLL